MDVRRSALGHEVDAPAKLNLFLEVLGKRSDGFHEIETLMTPVSLYDSLSITARRTSELSLLCRDVGSEASAESVPTDDSNLIIRALRLLRERAGVDRGAHVCLVKRIPMAAGLAGGSSDAAAALLLGNAAWGLDWSREKLAGLAADLGSDIPFFLHRGAAVCRGRGERIEPIAGLGGLHLVIVAPPVALSTAEVYRHCKAASKPRTVGSLVEHLRAGRMGDAARSLHNQLQAVAELLSEWIQRLSNEFAHVGCLGHQMSGSGTSYFGLCSSARHAHRIAAQLRSRRLGRVFAVGTCC
jgi:4-diphosphocytidyl-2-C-methyl-D-erythritol kinase